jgi:hypothetical protein
MTLSFQNSLRHLAGIFLLVFLTINCFGQNVGIGTETPAVSAKLEVQSQNSGFLPPRLNNMERGAIPSPVAGLVIYNTTSNTLEIFDGENWTPLVKQGSAVNAAASRKLYGGFGIDRVYAIDEAPQGGYFLLGSSASGNNGTISNVTVTSSAEDVWLMRIDAAGKILWQKYYGGLSSDFGVGLDATTDGGCIIGGYSNDATGGIFTNPAYLGVDAIVLKISSFGSVQWYKILGGNGNDFIQSVKQTSDGGYIASGYTNSGNTGGLTGINGNGNEDGWVVRFDASGNITWQKLFGGNQDDRLTSIIQTADQSFILSGTSFSSNTGTLAGITNNGSSDIWVLKLNAMGNLQWQKLLGGSSFELQDPNSSNNIIQTGDLKYMVVSSSNSSNSGTLTGLTNNGFSDCWIIKLDEFGNLEWQRLLGGNSDDLTFGIINAPQFGAVVFGASGSSNSGTFAGINNAGSIDGFIFILDASGNLVSKKLIGGASQDALYSIKLTGEGYTVAGYSASAGTGFLTGLTGNGNYDAWWLKLDLFGNTY